MFYKYIVRGMIDNLNDYDWMPEMSKFLYEMNPNYVPHYSDNLTADQQREHQKNLENHGKVTSYLATQAIAPGDEFDEEALGPPPDSWVRPVHELPEYIDPQDGVVQAPQRRDDNQDNGQGGVKQEPPRAGGDRFNVPDANGKGSTPEPSTEEDSDDDSFDKYRNSPDDTRYIRKSDTKNDDDTDDDEQGPEKPGNRIRVAVQSPQLTEAELSDQAAREKTDELKKMIGAMNREDVVYFIKNRHGQYRRISPSEVVNFAKNEHRIIKFLNEDATGRVLRYVRVKKDTAKYSSIQSGFHPSSHIGNSFDVSATLNAKKKANEKQMKLTQAQLKEASRREMVDIKRTLKPDTSPKELHELDLTDEVAEEKRQADRRKDMDDIEGSVKRVDRMGEELKEIVAKDTDAEAIAEAHKRIDEKHTERKPFVYDPDDELTKSMVDEKKEIERQERFKENEQFRKEHEEQKQHRTQAIAESVSKHEEEHILPALEDKNQPRILVAPDPESEESSNDSDVETSSISSEILDAFDDPLSESVEYKAATVDRTARAREEIIDQKLIDQFSLVNERGFYARAKAKKTLDIIDQTLRDLIGKEAASDADEAEIEKAAALMVVLDRQMVSNIEDLQKMIDDATLANFWSREWKKDTGVNKDSAFQKTWREGLDFSLQARIHALRRDAKEKREQLKSLQSEADAIDIVMGTDPDAEALGERLADIRGQIEQLESVVQSEMSIEKIIKNIQEAPSLDESGDEGSGEEEDVDIMTIEQTRIASMIRSHAALDAVESTVLSRIESTWFDERAYTELQENIDTLDQWLAHVSEGRLRELMLETAHLSRNVDMLSPTKLLAVSSIAEQKVLPERRAIVTQVADDIAKAHRLIDEGKIKEAEVETYVAYINKILTGYESKAKGHETVSQLRNTVASAIAASYAPDIRALVERVHIGNDEEDLMQLFNEVTQEKQTIKRAYLFTRDAMIKAVKNKILAPGLAASGENEAFSRALPPQPDFEREARNDDPALDQPYNEEGRPNIGRNLLAIARARAGRNLPGRTDPKESGVTEYLRGMVDIAEAMINVGLESEAAKVELLLVDAMESAWKKRTGTGHEVEDMNQLITDVAKVTSAALAERLLVYMDALSGELAAQFNISGVNFNKQEMLEMVVDIIKQAKQNNNQ